MYKLRLSRREKRKLLRLRWLIVAALLMAFVIVMWLAWIRPIQKESAVDSFAACVKAGYPVQESYPEVCLAKNGKRFINPKQAQAHQTSQLEQELLIPPDNPALLNLDIKEWGVRVPLTTQTFDLIYSYFENGGEESVQFTYKRLVQKEVCKGDIGMELTRSVLLNQPPYIPERPAPTAKLGQYYYYVAYAKSPCYDPKNEEIVALVKEIAGKQSLTQATAKLLTKLVVTPHQ